MTPLEAVLRRRLAAEGAISIADFMGEALGHPEHGYYRTRDPLGRAGDFTTAPEISQMFGELIGFWCAHLWQEMGQPTRLNLVELGPGRGTLMADLLRAVSKVAPAFRAAIQVHLVETSPVLREAQAKALTARSEFPTWHDDVVSLPEDAPLLIVANEFFDALPIRQLQCTEKGWCERLVVVDPDTDSLSIALAPGEGPSASLVPESTRTTAAEGKIVELSPISWRIVGDLARRLQEQGGAALIIDYGYEGPATGDTLQAVRDHKPCGVLEEPGEVDLTAHVDFTALAKAAVEQGVRATPVRGQGAFLNALGLAQRTERLCRAAPDQTAAIQSGRDRLTDPHGMGTVFKAIGLSALPQTALPGLDNG